ncbi:(2Fe-2S)-binding protein [Paenibacillus alginolyticus]|uniref:(2Fe-2S)-binding protein n=1 Tax=Paenibacillus alginolyticus TaxID=59839 RepID=UPI0003F89B39|nr:(2Fe-2S)-binding protein [Paenibacillus alginolyticus]MCY9666663.1 (2Fe-2S)-binding protein [Paenibacillus alginolyticus]
MSYGRIMNHPILGEWSERKGITFRFDDQEYEAFEGEAIAAALLAQGIRTLRYHEETRTPRGFYCNIGHCFECRVTVDGIDGQRACLTLLTNGLDVRTGKSLPSPLKKGAHLP